MALFGLGKNKKTSAAGGGETSKKQETIRYDGEPVVGIGNEQKMMQADLQVVYDEIYAKGSGAQQVDDGIFYEETGLHLTCCIQRVSNSSNGNCSAEMLFIMTHPLFDEPLCEYTAGLGDSRQKALQSGAEQFCAVVLMPVLAVFGCTGEHQIETEFAGRKHIFLRNCTSATLAFGVQNPNQRDLWEIVEKEIPQYLGAKNVYWIKLYACCIDGAPNCEVRINGAVFPELTKKMEEYVMSWQDRKNFHSEKAFYALLRQDACEPDGLNHEAVVELAMKTAGLMADMTADAKEGTAWDAAMAEISRLCGTDRSLFWELQSFIPEIFTVYALNLKQGDGMVIQYNGMQVSVKKSQLKTYGYIEQGVYRYLQEKRPTREQGLNIMCMSAIFSAVNQALQKGSKLEDLYFTDLYYNAPDDYVMR